MLFVSSQRGSVRLLERTDDTGKGETFERQHVRPVLSDLHTLSVCTGEWCRLYIIGRIMELVDNYVRNKFIHGSSCACLFSILFAGEFTERSFGRIYVGDFVTFSKLDPTRLYL